MINAFLDWAQEQQNGKFLYFHAHPSLFMRFIVWIVSSEQLLAYAQNPVPLSQLESFEPLKCSTPSVDPSLNICNGVPANEEGTLAHCAFSESPFYTCVSLSFRDECPIADAVRVVWLPGHTTNGGES